MRRPSPETFSTERLERFDGQWTRRTLANGMTAIHVPCPSDDRFYLGVMIKAGTRLEDEASCGTSHFLEHMMFRGSRLYPEFTRLAEAFEWLGGDWNAATGHEHTEYWYAGIRHTAGEVIELFADFLETPLFSEIEVERQVILRELDGETNELGHSTDLDYHVGTLIWPGSSFALPILGSRESISRLTEQDLRAWRDRYYTPRNMVVCAIGGDEGVMDEVTRHFGTHRQALSASGMTRYPELTSFAGPAVKWVENSDNEYEIRLSFLCGGEWSPDAPVYDLIARILSDGFCSRLNKRLREELGLVYDIGADATLSLDTGALSVSASCAKDQLDEFLRELVALLATFVAEGPTEDELRRAALRGVVDLELSPMHLEYIAARLSWLTLCGRDRKLADERGRLLAVTVDDVRRVLREVLSPERAALVAMGPSGRDIEKRLRKALAGLTPAR